MGLDQDVNIPFSDNPCNLNNYEFFCRYWLEITVVIINIFLMCVICFFWYLCYCKKQSQERILNNSDGQRSDDPSEILILNHTMKYARKIQHLAQITKPKQHKKQKDLDDA